MLFPETTDEEFESGFMHMISKGRKDNDYKFALARFLLEHSAKNDAKIHVEFKEIAEKFLEYFWPQVCQAKLMHNAFGETRKPEIIQIIEEEFDTTVHYPKGYSWIKNRERQKIKNCIEKIVESCFYDVIWRFQKKNNKETKLLFDYKVQDGWTNPNKKKTDLQYGINLNPEAMRFFRQHNAPLKKSVTLEWTRFLEKFNIGMPKLVPKIEGSKIARNQPYANEAKSEFRRVGIEKCFYCLNPLQPGSDTQLEHFIPFDFISDDNIWNFTLACKACNWKKLAALPEKSKIDELITQHLTCFYAKEDEKKIDMLTDSLTELGLDNTKTPEETREELREIIETPWKNALKFGYLPKVIP